MEYALQLHHVSKELNDFQLQDVSFALPVGTIMGLIGENGAGKTTMMKLILDLLKRDEGTITVLGYPAERFSKEKNEAIGVVMDECNFAETLNRDEIGRMMEYIYQQWDKERFAQLSERFGLPKKRTIKEYSRGMKMKLSIAVALSHQAKLLLLDEATSGLDPIVREEILDLLLEFIQDEQCAVLLSSHIVSDLEKICDYITYIHGGQLLFTEEKDALREKYGIIRCNQAEKEKIPQEAVIRIRQNKFGNELLVWQEKLLPGQQSERASIEDIMLFYGRGGEK